MTTEMTVGGRIPATTTGIGMIGGGMNGTNAENGKNAVTAKRIGAGIGAKDPIIAPIPAIAEEASGLIFED